jgi:predicted nucleotidyltransferase
MIREEIENIILNYLIQFKPERIGIFGSFARNQSSTLSDIDLLVKFKKAPSILQLIRMENELSVKIGRKVDLVTDGALTNTRIRKNIQKDLYVIYNA